MTENLRPVLIALVGLALLGGFAILWKLLGWARSRQQTAWRVFADRRGWVFTVRGTVMKVAGLHAGRPFSAVSRIRRGGSGRFVVMRLELGDTVPQELELSREELGEASLAPPVMECLKEARRRYRSFSLKQGLLEAEWNSVRGTVDELAGAVAPMLALADALRAAPEASPLQSEV